MDRKYSYVDYHKMLGFSVVASMPYVHKLNEAHDSFIYMYLWSFLNGNPTNSGQIKYRAHINY